MKHRLLPSVATFVLATACWAVSARACDDQKKSAQATAASAHATCTAEMAAKCTATQAAACKAKGTSAVTASTASAAGSGGSCSGRGFTASIESFHHGGCDACADMSLCDQELKSASSVAQVVKLKNGVMFIHTASNPSDVRAIQTAMMRRNERLNALSAAGDKVKLCPDCKVMRGAIASGKLTREMVPIEGGCLTLMTSNDAKIVSKLHELAGTQTTARVKI